MWPFSPGFARSSFQEEDLVVTLIDPPPARAVARPVAGTRHYVKKLLHCRAECYSVASAGFCWRRRPLVRTAFGSLSLLVWKAKRGSVRRPRARRPSCLSMSYRGVSLHADLDIGLTKVPRPTPSHASSCATRLRHH